MTWTVLTKGEYPWEKAKGHLDNLNNLPDKHKTVICNRHEAITKNTPDFMPIGDQGFLGYITLYNLTFI